jgi:branched-chain amino acid transport system ATP-binding protein
MAEAARCGAGNLMQIRGVTRRFGGLVATDSVNLDVAEGEIHALIGPNGAGKTTLIAQLAGSLAPDEGTIRFRGADVTHLSQHARVAAGLARSFQITSIFRSFSVRDNLALAVQARNGSSLSFWRPVTAERALFDEAAAVAARVGLAGRLDTIAATLAHGEQRALEVGLALATNPALVLLDEPMAGMGPEESRFMIDLIRQVRDAATVLLVEHDMDAVFRLAQVLTVMVNGKILASGDAEAIRANPEVQRAYLGESL